MLNLKKKKLNHRGEIDGCQRAEVGKRGGMNEGSQKVQTSSYKIKESWDVMSSMVTILNNKEFLKAIKTVNLKSSHHKKKM